MTDLEVAGVGDYLAERRDDIARLLIELADNESPSLVPESQGAIQEIVSRRLEAIGFVAQFFPGEENFTGGEMEVVGQTVRLVDLNIRPIEGEGLGGEQAKEDEKTHKTLLNSLQVYREGRRF